MKDQNATTNQDTQLATQEATALAALNQAPIGFDDDNEDDSEDLIIPRVKVIQSLSPERKEKIADEGDIIDSLTKDKLNGKKFIPVFKFNNNLLWTPRDLGGGMACVARDGKTGVDMTTGASLACKFCKKNEFDNSKTGKDAIPECVKYMNFFGFFEGERSPIILSFAKTNYAEGKKLYSLAKVTMQNMFNNGYNLVSKEVTKANNSWYIIDVKAAGATSAEDREFALAVFNMYKPMMTTMNIDFEAAVGSDSDIVDVNIDDTATEY